MATVDITRVTGNAPPPIYVDIAGVNAQNIVPTGATVDLASMWMIKPAVPTATVQIATVYARGTSRATVDIATTTLLLAAQPLVDIATVEALKPYVPTFAGLLWKERIGGNWVDLTTVRPMIRVGGTFVPL